MPTTRYSEYPKIIGPGSICFPGRSIEYNLRCLLSAIDDSHINLLFEGFVRMRTEKCLPIHYYYDNIYTDTSADRSCKGNDYRDVSRVRYRP